MLHHETGTTPTEEKQLARLRTFYHMNDPQMSEKDESNPYTYRVNDDLSFTVIYRGEEVHTSRAFRLRVQADRQAIEWIQRALDQEPLGAITLDVQSMSIDADSLLRRF